jgi:hypothetical protein
MNPGSLFAGGRPRIREAAGVWIEWGGEARPVSPLCGGARSVGALPPEKLARRIREGRGVRREWVVRESR